LITNKNIIIFGVRFVGVGLTPKGLNVRGVTKLDLGSVT
jgi:hypothetical protein